MLSQQDTLLHIQRCMEAPRLDAAFTAPYTIERHPVSPLPVPIPLKRMTYDEAYELAYERACEADSPNSPDFESVCDHFFDLLCTKHDISD